MRFMMMFKTSPAAKLSDERAAALDRYRQEMEEAGVIIAAARLLPSPTATRIGSASMRPSVKDGPFSEAKELIAGFAILEVASQEEAVEWARRWPSPKGEEWEIEIRQVHSSFGLGAESTTAAASHQ